MGSDEVHGPDLHWHLSSHLLTSGYRVPEMPSEGPQACHQQAQVRPIGILGSLPQPHPPTLEPRPVLSAKAFPGSLQRTVSLPACPGTL